MFMKDYTTLIYGGNRGGAGRREGEGEIPDPMELL